MKRLFISFPGILLLSLFSCSTPPPKVVFQGQTQGTYYAVTYFDVEGRNFQPAVDSILRAFDLSVSMWEPESIISRINNGDSTIRPDEWFIDLFIMSEDIAIKTKGLFDITVGPLVNAWGFGFKGKLQMNQIIVDSLKQLVDYRAIRLENGKIIKEKENIQFDFNAIAQGYAVDLICEFLGQQGVQNYLVDIGGEVSARGAKPDGQPWVVGIENPASDSLSERSVNTRIRLVNQAVSTSGNYRKYYEENGIRYSHTIDPESGYPVRHSLLSVSVLAGDCATADGYATAFMVMGYEKARKFVEKEPGLEAFFIIDAGSGLYQTYATKGFDEIIVK